jgi:hypothetical protein
MAKGFGTRGEKGKKLPMRSKKEKQAVKRAKQGR